MIENEYSRIIGAAIFNLCAAGWYDNSGLFLVTL